MTGNLSVDAQQRYLLIRGWLLADLPPPARVIELGAAPGDQIAALARLGYETTAVDLGIASDEWSDRSSGRMERLLKEAGVKLILWNLEETPYPLPDAAFDAVLMTEVYEHLRDYPVRALFEARRILRPGGRIYFTTPNAAYLMNRVRLLLGRSVATPLPDWIDGLPHARHAREYTFAEIKELFDRCGLTVTLATSRHFHVDSGRQGRLAVAMKRVLDRVSRMRPTVGGAIVVVAERST